MTTCTTTLHGDDLAYEFHQGTGTPLLLVHGVGSSTKTWSEVLGRLLEQVLEIVAGLRVAAVELLERAKETIAPTLDDLLSVGLRQTPHQPQAEAYSQWSSGG